MNKKYMAMIAVVIVGAIGGCSGKDKDTATPTPSASSAAAASPQVTASKAPRYVLSLPPTLNKRVVNTNEDAPSYQLEWALKESVAGGSGAVSSTWGTKAAKNLVIAGVIEAKNPTGADAGKAIAALVQSGEMQVGSLTLGKDATGSSGCGVVVIKGAKHAICAWADERSVGIIIWYGKTPTEVKAEFPELRKQFFLVL